MVLKVPGDSLQKVEREFTKIIDSRTLDLTLLLLLNQKESLIIQKINIKFI